MIKDLCPEYMKNFQTSTIWKQATQLKDGQNTLADTSPKRMHRYQLSMLKDVEHH